jgi:putative transposase
MYGVESICSVLSQHGVKIAPSTYYETRNRAPSRRALRDVEVIDLIRVARDHRFRVRFGARKMWLHLRAQGHDVARCTVERLMAAQGWSGALRGKKPRTTIPAPGDPRPADLVDRGLHRYPTEPALGRGLHLRRDLVRHGLRRVRL